MVNYFFFLAHLIYQSQNLHLYRNLARTLEGAQLSAKWYFISPFDCLVLANFLAWCDCSLRLLNLDNCGLTSQSLEIIHRVNLKHHGTTQIEEVHLSNNPKVLTKLSLLLKLPLFEHTRRLTIHGLQCPEGVSPDQVELCCLLNLRHLTMLDISEKVAYNAGFFLSLDTFELRIGNVHIESAANIIRFLEQNTNVVKLYMQPCTLSDRCVVSLLKQMTTRPTLRIIGEVTILGVGRVEMDTVIVTLSCDAVGMSPEKSMEFLRALNHSGVEISRLDVLNLTNEFATHLADGLAKNLILESLALKHRISCAGAVSIYRSLEHNTSLEELDLSRNSQLAEGDSEAMGCAIESCEVTDSMAKHIAGGLTKNTSLRKLYMQPCTLSDRCVVSLLKQMTTHPTLRIIGEVTVLGVGRVEMDTVIVTLSCDAVGMSPEKSMEFLRALNHSGVKISRLDVLNLTNEFATHLADGLAKNLIVKSLALKHIISCAGAVSIFRSLEYNSLRELDLSYVWNSHLREGDSEAVGYAIEKILKENRTLEVLKLQVTDSMAKHITTGLTKNTSLVKLDMKSYSLSGRCAVSLLQQVTNFPTLTMCIDILEVGRVVVFEGTATITLPYNAGNMNPENCVEILRTLNHIGVKVTAHSQKFMLNKRMEESVSLAVSEMLSCNESLTELDLSSFDIPDPALREIARALFHNTSLMKLDISGYCMGMEGSVALAEMLSCNKSLTELTLRYIIPDPCLREIARGLLHNTSLQTLQVGFTLLKNFPLKQRYSREVKT